MKKVLYLTASLLLFLLLGWLTFLGFRTRGTSKAELNDNQSCKNTPTAQLDSERSQGILIKDRKVLAVRLSGETNYSVPGGHIDLGESAQTALHRELKEEVGIDSDIKSYEFYKMDCQPKGDKQQRIYYYKVKSWTDNIVLGGSDDKTKWADSSYTEKKKADTDLKLVIYFLKQDGLID